QSFFEIAFEEAQNLLQTEADGFAAVLQSLAGFDIVSQAGDAISIFEGAGTALLTLFFCMEAFTYCASIDFNGGIEGAIRVAMKLVVSALIVQNVDNIVGIISGLFRSEVDFASAFDGIGAAFGDAMNQGTPLEGGLLDINYIVLTLLYVIIIILMFVMFSLIVVTVLGVVFETAILTAISPVALATLVNTQARSAGISFIKNFAAVSMQWGVLAICFKAYTIISANLALDFSAGLNGAGLLMHIFKYATPVLSVVMLAITVAKSSDITKRALGG
ncbi:hypothetical protein, partial [Huintestinicola sp.]|uniref:hypothetical protein n=1 Tax=Huintestinicola sp. TaxID=2981661 RepID=UPI003D7DE21E